jgi:TetR/AcrR family transcriptional regulator of autoinduction and epiphytic fitness
MTQNEPRTRLTDRKRAAILDAAAREFRSRGFDNTSMDGIATAATVSKRTVYNHFASKEELFTAIVDELMSRCEAAVEYPFDEHKTLEKQLSDIGRSAIELFASDDLQNLARVVASRFLQSPELARTVIGDSKPLDRQVAKWIQAGQKAGRLKSQKPQRAAKQFLGLIDSFALWPQILGGKPTLSKRERDEVVQSAVAMFLSHYAT